MQNFGSQAYFRVKLNLKVVDKVVDGSGYKITQQIDEELALIKEVKAMAQEAHAEKNTHKKNTNKIRAWRINVKMALQKQEESRLHSIEKQTYELALNRYTEKLNDVLAIELQVDSKQTAKRTLNTLTQLMQQAENSKSRLEELASKVSPEAAEVLLEEVDYYKSNLLRNYTETQEWIAKKDKSFEVVQVVDEDKLALNQQLKERVDNIVSVLNNRVGLTLYKAQTTRNQLNVVATADAYDQYQRWLSRLNYKLHDLENRSYMSYEKVSFADFKRALGMVLMFGNLDYSEEAYQAYLANEPLKKGDSKLAELESRYLNPLPFKLHKTTKRVRKAKDIEPLLISAYPDIRDVDVHDVEDGIPEDVLAELNHFSSGAYNRTSENTDRINEIASQFNLPDIELETETVALSADFNRKVTQLLDLANQVGQGQRNSIRGLRYIMQFKVKTERLIGATDKQIVAFNNAYLEFERASNNLENWIKTAWWQFGGQGERDKRVWSPKKGRTTSLPSLRKKK